MYLLELGTPAFALYFAIFALIVSVANGIYTIVITIKINKLVKKANELRDEE